MVEKELAMEEWKPPYNAYSCDDMCSYESVMEILEEIWDSLREFDSQSGQWDYQRCEELADIVCDQIVILLTKFTDYLANPQIKKKDIGIINLCLSVFKWNRLMDESIQLGKGAELLNQIFKDDEFWKKI